MKFPFVRHARRRAYEFVYTMLPSKDSTVQEHAGAEGELEPQDESLVHEEPSNLMRQFWTRNRQVHQLRVHSFWADIMHEMKLYRRPCFQHLCFSATGAL